MPKRKDAVIKTVEIDDTSLRVSLKDKRTLTLPLSMFPILKAAPSRARHRFKIAEDGGGIWWNNIGYDLGANGLVAQCRHEKRCTITRRR